MNTLFKKRNGDNFWVVEEAVLNIKKPATDDG
jgi:hypothetical protein